MPLRSLSLLALHWISRPGRSGGASPAGLAALALSAVLAGCAHTAIDEAEGLASQGRYEAALKTLDRAVERDPGNAALRTAQARERDRVLVRALAHAELALAAGQLEAVRALLGRLQPASPDAQARVAGLQTRLTQAEAARERARADYDSRRHAAAQAGSAQAAATPSPELAAAFRRPVTLALRDAPLRQLFESLSQAGGLNFVFDREVRGEDKATVFLRDVSIDEALRVVLATHGLDRKVLNDRTLLIYPDTPTKQREHRELLTRTLYLVDADAKQVLALVRTMTKTRDLYADDRLNALVVRDTPEIVAQVERMVALVDLPEPEVLLDVEVMEVASSQIESLGLTWPTAIDYGLPGVTGSVELGSRGQFRASIANPAIVATLRSDSGDNNLLANPSIRARHREKAKVQIGEKLPVFSTTSVVNAGVSTSVTYLDVGLKLEIEPSIQLDGDVVMKLALEVSNLVRQVTGPQGAIAYQVGTRATSTSLRLKDGETQVLAGLINDEDRRSATGLPGLSRLPLVGRLFGVHGDTRNKTEIVMLVTPHIVRRLQPPSAQAATLASGTDARPGAPMLRLTDGAAAGMPVGASPRRLQPGAGEPPAAGPAANGADGTAARQATAAGGEEATANAPLLVVSPTGRVGATVSVGLTNRSADSLSGELSFDPNAMRMLGGDAADAMRSGRVSVQLGGGEQRVWLFRLLPAAAGRALHVGWRGQAGEHASEWSGRIQVEDKADGAPGGRP